MTRVPSFVELLYAEAPREEFDALVSEAERAGTPDQELEVLREQRTTALRIREQMVRQRRREAELSALYETANDLTAIRDVDAILAAIVRRARQLLHADMTYLSLNDEDEGASYMKVTDGSVSAEFRNLRLPLGTGLLGLVAQTGAPYYTDDYQADARFVHRNYIDHAVEDENMRAILGVPLIVEGKVIGALLAGHRSVRAFPPSEVTLLTSFAAHAAIALENARLFEETQAAVAEVEVANRQIRAHSHAVEVAARAHDQLTDALLHGGGASDVAAVLANVLDGSVVVYDPDLHELATAGGSMSVFATLEAAIADARRSGRSVELSGADADETGSHAYVVTAHAGVEHLGTLVLHHCARPLGLADRRTLERGALVTALVLLFGRSVAEAEGRVRGELLGDLLSAHDEDPARLRERARRQGADLDRSGVVAVASVEMLDRHRAAQVAARFAGELNGLGGEHEGHVVLVVPGDEAEPVGRQLLERLRAAGGASTVGVALAEPGPELIGGAFREARRCVATLLTLGRAGEVSDSSGLGLAQLVLGNGGQEELDAFINEMIGPVLEYDKRRGTGLVATLDAWFASGSRPAETARSMHVHANTVAQRLDRIGTLLGAGWRDPARSLDLQMALRLSRLRR
ncbi:MAG TPA: GAF domain-containing protein [Nocardioidaceae bacterium]|nr:GAF domain-containing protein [Nocardioidaceae bacterium]